MDKSYFCSVIYNLIVLQNSRVHTFRLFVALQKSWIYYKKSSCFKKKLLYRPMICSVTCNMWTLARNATGFPQHLTAVQPVDCGHCNTWRSCCDGCNGYLHSTFCSMANSFSIVVNMCPRTQRALL